MKSSSRVYSSLNASFWERLGIPAIFLLILLFPYLILGENVFLPVTDNMDSNLAWWNSLKKSNSLFSTWNSQAPGMLLENPRFVYPSVWSVEGLFYSFFPVLIAYMLLKGAIFLSAYYSFRYWLKSQANLTLDGYLIPFLSLIWASMAFYVHRGIGIAALPLVVSVFQQLIDGKWRYSFAVFLIGYAFFSKLVLTGLYIWTGLLIWLIWEMLEKKKKPHLGLLGLAVLLGIWIIQEYQLIRGLFFNPGFQSHREDFSYDFGIWAHQLPWDFFLAGDQNGVHYSPILVLITLGLGWVANKQSLLFSIGKKSALLIMGIACSLSLLSFSSFASSLGKIIPVLSSLNLYRFEYWIPFLLFVSLIYWWAILDFRFNRLLIPVILIVNMFMYQYEWRYWINDYLNILPQQVPSFQSYYAEKQWEEIKQWIQAEDSTSRILHFNIPPAVSSFNGMNTLDGYLQVYPRHKKDQVYRVTFQELQKDPSLEQHLMQWGNKCYFQNAQFPDDYFMYKWREEVPLKEPEYDYSYLKDALGATHILAALPVQTNQLQYIRTFEHPESAWKVYLYRIEPN